MTFEMLILQLMVDHFIKLLYFPVNCALTPWEHAEAVTRISVERHLLLVIWWSEISSHPDNGAFQSNFQMLKFCVIEILETLD